MDTLASDSDLPVHKIWGLIGHASGYLAATPFIEEGCDSTNDENGNRNWTMLCL